jgi:hypothetical protein
MSYCLTDRHSGLDPESSAFLDSRLRGNDVLSICFAPCLWVLISVNELVIL